MSTTPDNIRDIRIIQMLAADVITRAEARQLLGVETELGAPGEGSIFVRRSDDVVVQHAPGNKWHVDDHGRLHVRHGSGGNIATYNADGWSGVWVEGAA